MGILGVGYNLHDHNTYDGSLHKQYERYTRFKYNMRSMDDHQLLNEFSNEVRKSDGLISFTTTDGFLREVIDNPFDRYINNILEYTPSNLWDNIRLEDNLYYIDHHQSHAAYAFLTSSYSKSDILAIDGLGVGNKRCFFFTSKGQCLDLSNVLPIGLMWNWSCILAGISTRNAGKLMGLSAYGQINTRYYTALELMVDQVEEKGGSAYYGEENIPPQDLAATVQQFTIDKVLEHILPLKTCDNICIAGGVAYNGYMNEMLTKFYKNVHVPPAPGDEGQAIGNYMHADYTINNHIAIPSTYLGDEYQVDESILDGLKWERKNISDITLQAAEAVAAGKIIGWYQGRSESGNRALGNRSIVADPRNPNIKDIINSTIKLREDYRPFAPSVLEEHYTKYFDTNQPSPYMSRIMPVVSDEIPGVTHIDGTARIQTVNKQLNERWYNLIDAFYNITGIPMVVNTSFNCQAPIVETPAHAIDTFKKTALDMVVINDYVVMK